MVCAAADVSFQLQLLRLSQATPCHATSAYHDKLGTAIYTRTFCLCGAMPCMIIDSHPLASFTGQIAILQVLCTLLACATCSSEACREFFAGTRSSKINAILGRHSGQALTWPMLMPAICLSTAVFGSDSCRLISQSCRQQCFSRCLYV